MARTASLTRVLPRSSSATDARNANVSWLQLNMRLESRRDARIAAVVTKLRKRRAHEAIRVSVLTVTPEVISAAAPTLLERPDAFNSLRRFLEGAKRPSDCKKAHSFALFFAVPVGTWERQMSLLSSVDNGITAS